MGYYATTCGNCGGPAIFFSIGPMWIDCAQCSERVRLLRLLIAIAGKRTRPKASKGPPQQAGGKGR